MTKTVFKKNLVSIITPVYNAERFLPEMIASVQKQSYENWELYLVDDKSTDGSVNLIKQFMETDKRIHLIQLPKNSGAAVARNAGIIAARGQYIAFLDSDDYWEKTKLIKQLAFMQECNYAFTYTNLRLVDEAGDVLKAAVPLPIALDYNGLLKNTAIACSSVMIDRESIGDFRMPLVRRGQDTATWLMLLRTRPNLVAYGLDEVLNNYRQVEGSISSNRITALRRTWHTYRHLEKLPLAQAIYYFTNYVMGAMKRRL